MAGFRPCLPEGADLRGLLDMQRLAGLVELEGRTLEVHPELRRPDRRRVRRGSPPDAFPQTRGEGFEPEQSRRVRKHRARIRPRETFSVQQLEKLLRMPSAHARVVLTCA